MPMFMDRHDMANTTHEDVARILSGFETSGIRVFVTTGNHDINNPPSVRVWRERHGGEREYYHFRYKDVLFFMISTEDPPKDTDALRDNDPETAEVIDAAYREVKEAIATQASEETLLEAVKPIEEYVGTINISDEQVAYFKQALADNPDVRWTFCLMHSPAWRTAAGHEQDPRNFAKIEDLLNLGTGSTLVHKNLEANRSMCWPTIP